MKHLLIAFAFFLFSTAAIGGAPSSTGSGTGGMSSSLWQTTLRAVYEQCAAQTNQRTTIDACIKLYERELKIVAAFDARKS